MIKYVIFDFDGTIADSRNVFLKVFNTVAEKHKFCKILTEDLPMLRKMSILNRCRYLKLPLYKIPMVAGEVIQLYHSYSHEINIYDGIKEVLSGLKSLGIEPVIISSNSKKNIEQILKDNLISVNQIYSVGNLYGKDTVIKNFLKKNRLNCSEVLYVGDELRDIEACRKCFVKIIWVNWGYDLAETVKDSGYNFEATTPSEITEIVKGMQ